MFKRFYLLMTTFVILHIVSNGVFAGSVQLPRTGQEQGYAAGD